MAMMVDAQSPRIALAHDWLVGLRGGEQVLDRLARRYGPTDLYTLVANGQPLTPAIDACTVHESPLRLVPGARGRFRRHLLPLMPWAAERLRPAPCDVLISTSSAVIKSIRPPAGAVHLCYCHSPARYIWEQTEDYGRGAGGRLREFGLRAIGGRFRAWDRRTASRVDHFLANSHHTAARITRCFDRDAAVVHPPVRTGYYTPDASLARQDFLLLVSALEPYKRTELVIEAANRAGWPLKIVGSGSQQDDLARRAGASVELLGRVDDAELRTLYRTARGLIFPQVEDFGIIPVEAQACGCPVIAYRAGGVLDSITEITGVLFPEQTSEAIEDAVRQLELRTIDSATCVANAARFSEARFDAEIDAHVRAALA